MIFKFAMGYPNIYDNAGWYPEGISHPSSYQTRSANDLFHDTVDHLGRFETEEGSFDVDGELIAQGSGFWTSPINLMNATNLLARLNEKKSRGLSGVGGFVDDFLLSSVGKHINLDIGDPIEKEFMVLLSSGFARAKEMYPDEIEIAEDLQLRMNEMLRSARAEYRQNGYINTQKYSLSGELRDSIFDALPC